MRVFALLILGVVRAGLNSIWFVLYDHENWLVYDFRDEKIYLFSFHHYLVFFICFIAPPVCVHHYHVSFSWSIFIIPWFRVWVKDPSFLTTIKRCIFIFPSLLLSNFLWNLVDGQLKIPMKIKRIQKLLWVNYINTMKTFYSNFDTEYTNDTEWFITRPANYRCSIKEPEMNKTLLFIIGLEPDEISPAGMKHKYE